MNESLRYAWVASLDTTERDVVTAALDLLCSVEAPASEAHSVARGMLRALRSVPARGH